MADGAGTETILPSFRARSPVPTRLHRGGRFRGWLGRRFGGDGELGDRIWRRLLHLVGGAVVLYYLLPSNVFVVITTQEALLFGLAFVLALELMREVAGLEMPTVRAVERDRVASFAYFAVALVAAVLLLPAPIGATVVLGTALIDPLIGELRLSNRLRAAYPILPILLYAGLADVVSRRWARGRSASASCSPSSPPSPPSAASTPRWSGWTTTS